MTKFKVGDRVRRVSKSEFPSEFGSVGDEFTVTGFYTPDSLQLSSDDRRHLNGAICSAFELVTPAGPVREVTRKEIVPGTYGVVDTSEATADGVRIKFPAARCSATELREAATVFNQLADALESV